MDRDHRLILNFLELLHNFKGTVGNVFMEAEHWKSENAGARRAFHMRGFRPAARHPHPFAAGDLQEKQRPQYSLPTEPFEPSCDGLLTIGEHIVFSCNSPLNGYLHLFNLGTSGKCVKLFPERQGSNCWVYGGNRFNLPAAITVAGPATAIHGQPERLLAIVAENNLDLTAKDLHPDFMEHTDYPAQNRGGFGGGVATGTPRLFQEGAVGQWEYGLLEWRVIE